MVETFREAVESSEKTLIPFLERNQSLFEPESFSARRRFLMRRYKLVSNMVKWRKHTGERFGIGELVRKVIIDAMTPTARTGWDVGGQEIMRKVRFCVSLSCQLAYLIFRRRYQRFCLKIYE